MPRRAPCRTGVCRDIDISVIESLAVESWFALPKAVSDDFNAKEVRIGILITRRKRLVSEDGTAVYQSARRSDKLGEGIQCLKKLAQVAADGLLSHPATGSVLVGYLNDDKDEDLRGYMHMIYRVHADPSESDVEGAAWVSAEGLKMVPLEPVSALIVGDLFS